MNFEVRLPGRISVWCLRAAGIDVDSYLELGHKLLMEKVKLPATVACNYFLADKPFEVQVTVLSERPAIHLKVEVENAAIGKKIRGALSHYSAENDGNAVAGREDRELDLCIKKILRVDGVTTQDVEDGKVTFSRRALEGLMRLCEEINHASRFNVLWLFVKGKIAKEDRAFVARWLVKRYAVERDPTTQDDIDTVFGNQRELAVREIADDLIRFVRDRQHINRAGPCEVLAATKDPRAAEVIASVLGEDDVLTRVAIECLARLKATQYATVIKPFVRHSDADVRRSAARALKKLGCPVETRPAAIHLVKTRSAIPKGLEEWSANLDFEDLKPRLEELAKCIQRGFGSREIAEVMGVADEMKVEQTKAFRFPVRSKERDSDLWLVIFMDDIDSPDLEIHAVPEIIRQLKRQKA